MPGERGRGSRPGPTPGNGPATSARVAPGKSASTARLLQLQARPGQVAADVSTTGAITSAAASASARGGPLLSLVAEADRPALSSETQARLLAAMPEHGFEAASSEETEAHAPASSTSSSPWI